MELLVRRADGHQPDDRMYDCLPMYHSVGGVVATGAMLVARRLGGDPREFLGAAISGTTSSSGGCTLFQYIGELCRYLVNAPPHPREQRASAAPLLRQRAARRHLGRIPPPLRHSAHPRILCRDRRQRRRSTISTASPAPSAACRRSWRTASRWRWSSSTIDAERAAARRRRLCIRCAPDEIGEAIGKIPTTPRSPAALRRLYRRGGDRAENPARCLRPGDAWFRTGDLMRTEPRGFFYFVDRIGDTFRWKGENVSTTEVAAAIVPSPASAKPTSMASRAGRRRRAGMAAMVRRRLGPRRFRPIWRAKLSPYARPRSCACATSRRPPPSSTPRARSARVSTRSDRDPLYFDDAAKAFVRLDAALYARIAAGEVRF